MWCSRVVGAGGVEESVLYLRVEARVCVCGGQMDELCDRFEWIDVDKENKDSPFYVTDYVNDIFGSYYKDREVRLLEQPSWLCVNELEQVGKSCGKSCRGSSLRGRTLEKNRTVKISLPCLMLLYRGEICM